jgi:predicted metal-dependent enzyme (double-stranded beta helix superfamily)
MASELYPCLKRLIAEVEAHVQSASEEKITIGVARSLQRLLTHAGEFLPGKYTRAVKPEGALYPLYVHPTGEFSIAAAICNIDCGTPIHDHGTWGVIGVYSGVEHEVRYTLPERVGDSPPLYLDERHRTKGDVTICCTSHQDVHEVRCGSDEPYVGIQIYGADIGSVERRAYDRETGRVRVFVSSWDFPSGKQ